MTIGIEELKKEKEYLIKVKSVLEKIINDNMQAVEYRANNINELKKFMWDNISDYTDNERGIALSEVDQSVNNVNDTIKNINQYKKSLDSPYFAKIVFEDNVTYNEMPIYIGMKSVQDNIEFYVYDWRAPISSMFYNYELGEAKYEAPVGEINGKILSKIQFKIQNGELVRCFKSDINIDDEYLQEILSNSNTDKMKNIVSTIQREQNMIIRNDGDQYLIVQGIAGSGKTSVALHRIAYLLYKDLNLKSNNVLIFSPNDVFSDYISSVLPELGEDNVLNSTFSEFALPYLKPYKNVENYSNFLERIYSNNINGDEKSAIEYKLSNQCKNDIDYFIDDYELSLNFGQDFIVNNKVINTIELKKMFIGKYNKFSYKERLEMISEYICNDVGISVRKNKKSILKHLQNVTQITYKAFELYNNFLNSKKLSQTNDRNQISYEDITPILYINFKVNDVSNCTNIKQVVIDEAQDFYEFQMEVLKLFFKNASFTILGDINQTINPYYKYEKLNELSKVFNNAKFLELKKTYRSSEEIINYSNEILNLSNVCAIRKKTCIPVEIKNVLCNNLKSTILTDITTMNNLGINKIAIITKDMVDADKVYKLLDEGDEEKLQLISTNTSTVKASTVVIPSYLSKGLEFEGVIACNSLDNNYNDDEKNLYYVVCTRAQHKLNIYNEPTKILKKTKKTN